MADVDAFAHEIALEDSLTWLDGYSVKVEDAGEKWLDVASGLRESGEYLRRALRYLEMRGVLVRHPRVQAWVRVEMGAQRG